MIRQNCWYPFFLIFVQENNQSIPLLRETFNPCIMGWELLHMKPLKLLTNIFLCLVLTVTSVSAEETEPEQPSEPESSLSAREETPEESSDPASVVTPQESGEEQSSDPAPVGEDTDEPGDPEAPSLPEEEAKPEEELPAEASEEKREEEAPKENSEAEPKYVVPEDFELRPEDRRAKQAVLSHGMAEALETMEEGTDYAAHQVILYCDDLDYVLSCAEIYHGTLESHELGVGVIVLDDEVSLKDAVLASWTREDLPFIEPNYLVELDEPLPLSEEEDLTDGSSVLGYSLPKANTWADTVYDLFDRPDPYLKDPSATTYQWFHESIGSYAAWSAGMGSDEILVGVVDYSVNENHDELAGKVISEDIGCGYYLGTGHGTSVAGVIASTANNGKGGAGIAPNVRILSINIFKNTTTATSSNISKAILKAVECEVDIINFSVGSRKYSRVEEEAVNRAYYSGIPFVAAAGNDGSNIQVFPSADENAIAVAASDRNGMRAAFSDYGPWITVSAPGVQMRLPTSSSKESVSRYTTTSGTSFAAPVVTGALALYMSKMGKINGDEAVALLRRSTMSAGSDGMGYGILSLEKMFLADQAEARIHVFDKDGNEISSFARPLPEGSYITLESVHSGDQDLLAYTTDGSDVKISGGELTHGEIYTIGDRIEVDSFPKNSKITIKALAVSSLGAAGKKASLTIATPVLPVVYKIKTVTLDHKSAALYLPDDGEGRDTVVLGTASLINTAGEEVSLDSVPHAWTSSNSAIAEVDESGTVTAKGAGSATIKLSILDGSRKTASCTVKVIQYAESISITGQDAVAPGSSASYKASVLPSSTSTRGVVWSLREPAEGITLSSSGVLKVSSSVPGETSVTITALAKDGSGTFGEKTIEIVPKASAIKIVTDDPRAEYNNKGVLKSITIFSSDLLDSAHKTRDEHTAEFSAEITGNRIPPVWKSSNPKVAEVDQSGVVTAVGKGKTTITCTASDGSRKKASFTVNVTVPVSYMRLSFGNHTSLAIGKSMDLKKYVSYGTAYGTPSKKSVTWSIEKVICLGSAERDITEEVLAGQIITLNKDTLKVKKTLENLVDFEEDLSVYLTLKAVTADGTEFSDSIDILLTGELEALLFEPTEGPYYECLVDTGYTTYLYSQFPIKYDISSSNPLVAGAYIDYTSEKRAEFEYTKNGKVYVITGYQYRVRIYSAYDTTGIATITVKALDGGNKKAVLKVRVSNP